MFAVLAQDGLIDEIRIDQDLRMLAPVLLVRGTMTVDLFHLVELVLWLRII